MVRGEAGGAWGFKIILMMFVYHKKIIILFDHKELANVSKKMVEIILGNIARRARRVQTQLVPFMNHVYVKR